jgi:hypothetical protein
MAAFFGLTACGGSSVRNPTPPATPKVVCGQVSSLVLYDGPDGAYDGQALARAGPVWFSAFGRVRSGKAVIRDFVSGSPTKVLIHIGTSAHPGLRIRGTECSTMRALRFCGYQQSPCDLPSPSGSRTLEGLGVPEVGILKGQHGDFTGYMLFPHTGKYLIWVQAGAHEEGSAVFQVD